MDGVNCYIFGCLYIWISEFCLREEWGCLLFGLFVIYFESWWTWFAYFVFGLILAFRFAWVVICTWFVDLDNWEAGLGGSGVG